MSNDSKIIVKPQDFTDIGYQNGYFLGSYKDGSYILYDKQGKVVMPSDKFAKATKGDYVPNALYIANNFVAMANNSDLKIVDFNGDTLNDLTKFLAIHKGFYLDGNLIYIHDDNGMSYYLDLSGKPVLGEEKGYSYMQVNNDTILKVKLDASYLQNNSVTPIAFYNTKGQLVCNVPDVAQTPNGDVEFSHTDTASLMQFSEGYAAYQDKNTKLVGFLDKTGKVVIPAKFDRCVLRFTNGVAGVFLPKDDKLSYIDIKGNVLFSIKAPDLYPMIAINGVVVNNYFDEPNNGTQSASVVANDLKGDQIFLSKTTYDEKGDVGAYTYVFGSGNPVLSKTYVDIQIDPFSHTAIMQTKDKHYGLYDLNGNEILPSVYDSIQPLNTPDGRVLLIKDNKVRIIQIVQNNSLSTTTANPATAVITPEYSGSAIASNKGLTDKYMYTFKEGKIEIDPGDDSILMLNGQFVPYKPIIIDGSSFVPLGLFANAFGAEISWDDNTHQATVNYKGTSIVVEIGITPASVDGKSKTLTVAPFIEDSITYVPLRFIAEAMGKTVGYEPAHSASNWQSCDYLAYHPVVWVEEPNLMNNGGKTQEQMTSWLKGELSKSAYLANLQGNMESFTKDSIEATTYIRQVGRYALYKSTTYPILVDMKNGLIYLVNLQNTSAWITKVDTSSKGQ